MKTDGAPSLHGEGAASLTRRVEALALALGFDLAGVSRRVPERDVAFFEHWLEDGCAGDMDYLARGLPRRRAPETLLPGMRSVLTVGLVYGPRDADEPVRAADALSNGRIARYAGGEDYHEVVLERLRAVAAGLEALAGRPVASRGYVDTGPVLERAHAAAAGLGWIGKNTCLIHPKLGSHLFLGVLLTDLELVEGEPMRDHCGTCRACLDACPTGALTEPYRLDARLCISYSTIESREAVAPALRPEHGDWVFGCDDCQDACPWNRPGDSGLAPDALGLRARLEPAAHWRRPTLAWLLSLDEDAWRAATPRSALRRARHRGLIRNALVAAGNSGDATLVPHVERHAIGEDDMLAEHAHWALERLLASKS